MSEEKTEGKQGITGRGWFIILMLFLCFPVGVVFLWIKSTFEQNMKIGLSIGFGIFFVLAIYTGMQEDSGSVESSKVVVVADEESSVDEVVEKSEIVYVESVDSYKIRGLISGDLAEAFQRSI